MLKKINRAEKIGKNEKWRNIMSGRFTNFEGVLLNHFNIYEQEKWEFSAYKWYNSSSN